MNPRIPMTLPEGKEKRRTLKSLLFPDSLCGRCKACRTVTTKTSEFLMCTALPTKYPQQPVSNCPSFVPRG